MNYTIKIKCIAALSVFLFGLAFIAFSQEKERYPFENEIKTYQRADSVSKPPKKGILFIGSSSIRLWNDLKERFPDKPIIQRGVGGCQLSHFVQYYMDKIVYPYKASQIFIYAGDNDIAAGKSAEQVAETFVEFWDLVREKQPKVPIYFLAIKPSNSRAKYIPTVEKANALIKEFLDKQKRGAYIDVASVVLGPDGKPDDRLFREDRLHLNSRGYDLWEQAIRPYLR